MPKRIATVVRREPRQERSRATVDAILQAATYILVKRGWQKFTTNAVADRAGVNIASLYQFFPNKEAIVAELERRHAVETRAKVLEVYAANSGDGIEARVRRLVEAAIAAHLVAPALHLAFAGQLPRHPRAPFESSLWMSGVTELAALELPHPELAAWMIATVSHTAVHEALVERLQDLESGALADELVAMVVSYVLRVRRRR